MAASVLRALDRTGTLHVASAGTTPGGDLTGVGEVLAERGINFTPVSRALHMSMAPDLLVIVCEEGCAACPYLPRASRIVRWPFEDPTGFDQASRFRALREMAAELDSRVRGLL